MLALISFAIIGVETARNIRRTAVASIGLLLALFVSQVFLSAEEPSPNSVQDSEYQEWIARYAKESTATKIGKEPSTIRVRLISHFHDGSERAKFLEMRNAGTGEHDCIIDSNGRVAHYLSRQGSNRYWPPTEFTNPKTTADRLATSDFERVNQLLTQLPSDGGKLPPRVRRLVVQVAEGDHFRVFTYDRESLPNAVEELLRIAGSNIVPLVPVFKPDAEWQIADRLDEVAVLLHPDGQRLFTAGKTIKVWQLETRRLLHETDSPIDSHKEFLFSPDGAKLLVHEQVGYLLNTMTYEWTDLSDDRPKPRFRGLSRPQFTADGKFLTSFVWRQSSQPMQAFDVQDGKQVSLPDHIPSDAGYYHELPNMPLAIWGTKKGALFVLCDTKQKREAIVLGRIKYIPDYALSPDRKLLAVKGLAVVEKSSPVDNRVGERIQICDANSGETISELIHWRPWGPSTGVPRKLVWSSDGYFLIEVTDRSVHVWSVPSGRRLGEIELPRSDTIDAGFLSNGELLFVCSNGKLHFWDPTAVFRRFRELDEAVVR